MIILLLIFTTCKYTQEDKTQKQKLPVILCHPQIHDLILKEYAVFIDEYPTDSFNMDTASRISISRLKSDESIHAFISFSFNRKTARYLLNRQIYVDSTNFVFIVSESDPGDYKSLRYYEFDPVDGVVNDFAAFICGGIGQIIAKKEGYLPARPYEREIKVEREFD